MNETTPRVGRIEFLFTDEGMSFSAENVMAFQMLASARILEMEGSAMYVNEKRAAEAQAPSLTLARNIPGLHS